MSRRITTRDALAAWTADRWSGLRPDGAPLFGSGGKAPELEAVGTPALHGEAASGEAMMSGRYEYGGQTIDVGPQGHPFTISLPSERFANWLHRFDWLPDLLATTDGEAKAAQLTAHWVSAFSGNNDFVYDSDRMAARLFMWGAAFDDIGAGSTDIAASYAAQMRRLKSVATGVSPGLPALQAQAALVLFGARLRGKAEGWLAKGLDGLDAEIAAQILPDGGHVSRSPYATFEALYTLHLTDRILQERGLTGSKALGRAVDRLAPMVATLRHSDGAMGVFHGGHEGRGSRISGMLAASGTEAQPFAFGPHTGIHRVQVEDTLMLVDTNDVPPRPYDTNAHLAPLAMELSTGEGRLIVNCGWHPGANPSWRRPVRASAAHSTLTLDDRSPGRILEDGFKARALGPAIEFGPQDVRNRRKEQASGIWLESSHDGYKPDYGLVHRRRLFMGEDGSDIRGEDSLFVPVGETPVRRDQIPFAIRFHFHPDVRVSLAQDLSSALLVQKGRAGWRFRTDGGPLAVEPSVYLGASARPVRAQQIVISGAAYGDGDGQGRDNRVRWSIRRLSDRRGEEGRA